MADTLKPPVYTIRCGPPESGSSLPLWKCDEAHTGASGVGRSPVDAFQACQSDLEKMFGTAWYQRVPPPDFANRLSELSSRLTRIDDRMNNADARLEALQAKLPPS